MIRTILKFAALAIVALIVVGGALYQFFGLRFVMDGGGVPQPTFLETRDEQAERIERHRDAQRATATVPAAQPAPESATVSTTTAQPATAPGER